MAVKGGGAGTAAVATGGAGTAASAGGGMAASGGAGTVAASGKGDALDDDPGTAGGGQGVAMEGGPGAALENPSASSAAGSGHGAATAVAPGLVADADGDGAGSASGAASSAWPEGMDPKSTYLLKLRLVGNQKKARKVIGCFSVDKFIDSDLANYKDLVESIVEQYSPRYLEVAHVQYYDDVLKTFPEVKSDQDLLSMFEKFSKTKVVQMFISYCDPSEPFEPITEFSSDVFIQPEINIEQDEDTYLCNPIPENEHVGIDEENMYFEKEPTPLNVVLFSDKEKDKESVHDDESEDESEYGTGIEEDDSEIEEDEPEIEEDEEVHEADHVPQIEYNKEDPPMTEGSKYPNIAEFKLAISQHAIKPEFEYKTEKSTPHRFRAYCSRKDEDKCPWRIHASTTDDLCTVVRTTKEEDKDDTSN